MNDTHKNLLLYITKCIAAVSFIYVLSYLFDYPDIGWCLLSAVMVLSPNAQEALPVARHVSPPIWSGALPYCYAC